MLMLTEEVAKNAVMAVDAADNVETEVRTILRSDRFISDREACLAEIKALRDAAFDAVFDYDRLLLKTKYRFVEECERRFPHLTFSKQLNGIHVYQDDIKLFRLNYWIRRKSDGVSVMFYQSMDADCDCLTWEALELTLS